MDCLTEISKLTLQFSALDWLSKLIILREFAKCNLKDLRFTIVYEIYILHDTRVCLYRLSTDTIGLTLQRPLK